MDSEENARLAKEVLDNPIFNLAISDLKQEIMRKWCASDSFDKEGREAAFLYYRSIDMVHGKISGYINKFLAESHQAEQLLDEYSIA